MNPAMTRILGRNWKTTFCGLVALLGVAAKFVSTGHFDPMTDGPAVMGAISAMVAKDGDVTGGTR